jgi:hypothetical protein
MSNSPDIQKLVAGESSNIDMNLLDSKVVKGFQKITGDNIYKIVSLYAYGLVKAKGKTSGDDLVTARGASLDGAAHAYDLDENNLVSGSGGALSATETARFYEGTVANGSAGITAGTGNHNGDYFPLSLGTSITGNFSEVKVLDGPMIVYGTNLSEPSFHLSFASDFANQSANLGLSNTTSNHGIIAWFDAADASTIDFRAGSSMDVTTWKNKVEPSGLTAQSFGQPTAANMPIYRDDIDLSTFGGNVNAKGIQFNGTTDYMIGNNASTFLNTSGMQPKITGNYWTVIMVVSGGTDFDGTILSRTKFNASSGGYMEHQYHYDVYKTAGGETFFDRVIGETTNNSPTGSSVTSVNINNGPAVIIASAGYDTSSGLFSDLIRINEAAGVALTGGSYNYGNWADNTSTTHLGANITSAAGVSNFLAGNIHEMIILKNRISIGDFNDYGLNSTMVNAIMRYIDFKWFGNSFIPDLY